MDDWQMVDQYLWTGVDYLWCCRSQGWHRNISALTSEQKQRATEIYSKLQKTIQLNNQ